MKEHWDWTLKNFVDADKMSSSLQGQWMIFMAQWIAPKRGEFSVTNLTEYILTFPFQS